MLCRHFCHVLPRAVISSVFASPSSWSSGELQRFSARCEETMPATGIRIPYQALLTVTDSPDPSNLSGGAQCLPLGLPSLGLPCKKLPPVLVSSMARAFVTQMSQVGRSSLSPCQHVPHAKPSAGTRQGRWRALWDGIESAWEGCIWAGILASQV